MRIVGLDLSLASTGYAVAQGGTATVGTLSTKLTGYDRLGWLREQILRVALPMDQDEPALVLVEGPAYNQQGGQKGHHERAGLWWLVTWELHRSRLPIAVVSIGSLKIYATGKGNASKDAMMLATARRFEWFDGDNNAADALWLAAMGADHLGMPLVEMPAVNRAALGKVAWPGVA